MWWRPSAGPRRPNWRTAAGAHTVVNYRDDDVVEQILAAAPDGIDLFVEVALDRNIELDLAVAAPHAVITSYAADADRASRQVPVRQTDGAEHHAALHAALHVRPRNWPTRSSAQPERSPPAR